MTYNAEVPLLLSEIDPVQNNAVSARSTRQVSARPRCGPASPAAAAIPRRRRINTCYPPAVNYTPLYYLINGVAFDKTNASASLFAAAVGPATGVTGTSWCAW